jgi:hypothetical protein
VFFFTIFSVCTPDAQSGNSSLEVEPTPGRHLAEDDAAAEGRVLQQLVHDALGLPLGLDGTSGLQHNVRRSLEARGAHGPNDDEDTVKDLLTLRAPLARSLADEMATDSSAAGSTTRSTSPIFRALSGLRFLPVRMQSSAA